MSDGSPLEFPTDEFYVKSREEMEAALPEFSDALDNTVKIAERCRVEFVFGQTKLPRFTAPGGRDSTEYFTDLCSRGLKKRYGAVTPELKARFDYEMGVVRSMGYVDYYLIVYDFVRYAKNAGIPWVRAGVGAGQLAGLLHGHHRGGPYEVPADLRAVSESGADQHAGFRYRFQRRAGGRRSSTTWSGGTGPTMWPRSPPSEPWPPRLRSGTWDGPWAWLIRRWTGWRSSSPTGRKSPLDGALEESPELKTLYDNDPQVRELLDTARKVEGMPRHGLHSCGGGGVTADPVDEYVPPG